MFKHQFETVNTRYHKKIIQKQLLLQENEPNQLELKKMFEVDLVQKERFENAKEKAKILYLNKL